MIFFPFLNVSNEASGSRALILDTDVSVGIEAGRIVHKAEVYIGDF